MEGECPEWASEASGGCLGTSASLQCRVSEQKVVLGTDKRTSHLQSLALDPVGVNMPTPQYLLKLL